MPFQQQDFDGRLQLLWRDVALCCETGTGLDERLDDARGVPVGHVEDQVIRERTNKREIVVLMRWHAIPRSATRARCMGPQVVCAPETRTDHQHKPRLARAA